MARPASSVVVIAASLVVAMVCSAASQDSTDEAADTALFEETCGSCHESAVVAGPFRTGAEWDEAIQRMQSYGLSAKPDVFARIRVRLLRNFGKANVNTAVATDLRPVFDVTPEVAEAIVSHRKENGPFKTLDDLKRVPGLDAAKVDARRARVSF